MFLRRKTYFHSLFQENTKKITNEEEMTEDDVEEKLLELYDELFGGTEDDS